MSTNDRSWPTLSAGFHCAGMVMTLTSVTFILAGNTDLFYRFEHNPFPLSWAIAVLAILAFVVAELTSPTKVLECEALARDAKDESSRFAPEWEAVDIQS